MGRTALLAAFVGGLALVAFSLTADVLGYGGGYAFGWEQKAGVALGSATAWLSGLALLGWRPLRWRDPVPEPSRRHAKPLSI